jgi:methionyl-tRNA formyltransferase
MTQTIRTLFMGTPEFAVPALRALIAAPRFEVIGVATQPDRPAGRGNKVAMSPVKHVALEAGIPVFQPASLRKDPAAVGALRDLAPDLVVVAAYGLILPQAVLDIPRYGCINVHASLLPAYRGASPITAALLDGLPETGVSIMRMDAGMDTGPVLAQASLPILPEDTNESLGERLAELGALALIPTLEEWLSGAIAPTPQDELPGEITLVRMIKKEMGRIDWSHSAAHIERMTRAYQPWPTAYTLWRNEPLRILRARVGDHFVGEPGTVVKLGGEIGVVTGDGLLLLEQVQPAGKKPMDARSFVNGAKDFVGSVLL